MNEIYTINVINGECNNIVYLLSPKETARQVYELISKPRPYLVSIDGIRSDRDLAPFAAPRVFKDGPDFCAGADKFLKKLTIDIIPFAEKNLPIKPAARAIVGYSLGGLFALWSLFNTDMFSAAASVSGSLWFDGFTDYIKDKGPLCSLQKIYISLGDREHITKEKRMALVDIKTKETQMYFATFAETVFEYTKGGHFADHEKRIAQGIDKLFK